MEGPEKGWERLLSLLEKRCVFEFVSQNEEVLEKEIDFIYRSAHNSKSVGEERESEEESEEEEGEEEEEKGEGERGQQALEQMLDGLWKIWQQFLLSSGVSHFHSFLRLYPSLSSSSPSSSSSSLQEWCEKQLALATNSFHNCLVNVLPLFLALEKRVEERGGKGEGVEKRVRERMRKVIQPALFSGVSFLSEILFQFFEKKFLDYVEMVGGDEEEEEEDEEEEEEEKEEEEIETSLEVAEHVSSSEEFQEFQELCKKLSEMGLILASEPVFSQILFFQVLSYLYLAFSFLDSSPFVFDSFNSFLILSPISKKI